MGGLINATSWGWGGALWPTPGLLKTNQINEALLEPYFQTTFCTGTKFIQIILSQSPKFAEILRIGGFSLKLANFEKLAKSFL